MNRKAPGVHEQCSHKHSSFHKFLRHNINPKGAPEKQTSDYEWVAAKFRV